MKALAVTIIVIILIALGFWVWKGARYASAPTTSTSTATSTSSEVKDYSDPQGAFSFRYPHSYAVTGRQSASSSAEGMGWSLFSQRPGLVLAKAYISREYMPNTNFSEAWFAVGWSNDPEAIRNCTKNPSDRAITAASTTISGLPFTSFSATGAGAGNYYDTVEYRAILDGDCWALDRTSHYTNLGNYDPSLGVKEFDKAKVESDLESMVKSFQFKVNSD